MGMQSFELSLNDGAVVILICFVIPLIIVISILLFKYFQTRSNNNLKQTMLDQGMSAQEIEQVMNAGPKSE